VGFKSGFFKVALLYAALFVVAFILNFLGWDMFAYEKFAAPVFAVGIAAIAFYEGLKK